EVHELPEEGLLHVLRVVPFPELTVDAEQLRGANVEPAALETREDLAREPAPDRVGLDQDECALRRHGAPSLLSPPPPTPLRWERRQLERRRRFDRRGAVRADLPERLERGLAGRAGLLQLRRADGTDEGRGLDLRA